MQEQLLLMMSSC